MPNFQWLALASLAVTIVALLMVAQTKERVSWPGWVLPAAFAVVSVGWAGFAIVREGAAGFWPQVTGSWWGMQAWHDRLMCLAVAFFLLQNRARAAGMKSEMWVLLVIFTGSAGLLAMLSRMLYLERNAPVQ